VVERLLRRLDPEFVLSAIERAIDYYSSEQGMVEMLYNLDVLCKDSIQCWEKVHKIAVAVLNLAQDRIMQLGGGEGGEEGEASEAS